MVIRCETPRPVVVVENRGGGLDAHVVENRYFVYPVVDCDVFLTVRTE
jgi:hypothetical protein